jgi:hypothetical protein
VSSGVSEREQEPSRRVPVRLPPWMAGNNILQYLDEAAIKPTAIDASTYRWELETRESYERRPPRLMTVETLAGPGQPERWDVLQALPDPGITPSLSLDQVFAERDRILNERPGDLVALVDALRTVVCLVPHAEMAAAARAGYKNLATLPADGLPPPLLPGLNVKFVGVNPALMKRLALARVLMRIEEEPELLTNRPTPAPGVPAFGSGWHLTSDLGLTRDAYLAPLFLAASPWVWSIPCPRLPGVIVYDLGLAIVGRRGEAAELLQVFFPPGMLNGGVRPPIRSEHTTAATSWWVAQMDRILSQLSDFANYCDALGAFVPRRLFETFMSVEQLGRRLQGVLVHDRDVVTRRALAFDAFDTMKGLGIIDLFEGCKLSRAERVLTSLEATLPRQPPSCCFSPPGGPSRRCDSCSVGSSCPPGPLARLSGCRTSRGTTESGRSRRLSLSTCSCCGTPTTALHLSVMRRNGETRSFSWLTTGTSLETLLSCRTCTGWTRSPTPNGSLVRCGRAHAQPACRLLTEARGGRLTPRPDGALSSSRRLRIGERAAWLPPQASQACHQLPHRASRPLVVGVCSRQRVRPMGRVLPWATECQVGACRDGRR